MVKIIVFTIALICTPIGAVFATATNDIVRGIAVVTDGDTIRINDQRIRLHGIDAPERKQSCRTEQVVVWPYGQVVTDILNDALADKTVTCVGIEYDVCKRLVAKCSFDEQDISAWLVKDGYAFAYRKYSLDYVSDETFAQSHDLDLWSGVVQHPQMFRLASQREEKPPSATCNIKGNISKSGRIYHVPGSKWYSRTKIDSGRGERWFCSIQEAINAGWRAPRG